MSTSRNAATNGCAPTDAVLDRTGKGGFNIAAHGLRGLASIMVLLAHIIGGTARHIYPNDASYVRFIEHPWYLGTFGVEIFFVISGFVILPSVMRYDWREFGARRIVRIYPLFFVLSLVFIVLNAHTNSYPRINNVGSILSGLLCINLFTGTEQLTPNAWSLSFEIWFYVLTACFVTLAVKRRSRWPALLAAIAATAFLVAFPITTYFLIGLALRLSGCARRTATGATRVVEAASFAALVWFASRAHFDYTSWRQFANGIVPPILMTISVYFACALQRGSLTARMLGGRIFRFLGDVSYSLYLIHPFVYYALRLVFVRLGWFTGDVALSLGTFAAAVVAGSFLAANVVHAALERWPYRILFGEGVYHAQTRHSDAAVA